MDLHAIAALDVQKSFGFVEAVRNVSLEILEGEFFSLLGPSGCGKTTMLRMMAGFEVPDRGAILLRGEDVTTRPPNKRAVNMVFQNYELFPHMTVFDNVAYGLKLKKVPKHAMRTQVMEMLEIVGVARMEDRNATQLSGGQQQRVALARALVNRPAVLLLDEPMSALDVKLRKKMQLEMKSIQHELGTTFVYVTHDQEEALLMSDRIGIMSDGRLLQVGAPREIYERPVDPFVADFVGTLNEFSFRVDSVEGNVAVMQLSHEDRVTLPVVIPPAVGDLLRVAVRPERVKVSLPEEVPASVDNRIRCVVADVIYLGPTTQLHIDAPYIGRITTHTVSDSTAVQLTRGDDVVISWAAEAAFVLSDPGTASAVQPATALGE